MKRSGSKDLACSFVFLVNSINQAEYRLVLGQASIVDLLQAAQRLAPRWLTFVVTSTSNSLGIDENCLVDANYLPEDVATVIDADLPEEFSSLKAPLEKKSGSNLLYAQHVIRALKGHLIEPAVLLRFLLSRPSEQHQLNHVHALYDFSFRAQFPINERPLVLLILSLILAARWPLDKEVIQGTLSKLDACRNSIALDHTLTQLTTGGLIVPNQHNEYSFRHGSVRAWLLDGHVPQCEPMCSQEAAPGECGVKRGVSDSDDFEIDLAQGHLLLAVQYLSMAHVLQAKSFLQSFKLPNDCTQALAASSRQQAQFVLEASLHLCTETGGEPFVPEGQAVAALRELAGVDVLSCPSTVRTSRNNKRETGVLRLLKEHLQKNSAKRNGLGSGRTKEHLAAAVLLLKASASIKAHKDAIGMVIDCGKHDAVDGILDCVADGEKLHMGDWTLKPLFHKTFKDTDRHKRIKRQMELIKILVSRGAGQTLLNYENLSPEEGSAEIVQRGLVLGQAGCKKTEGPLPTT